MAQKGTKGIKREQKGMIGHKWEYFVGYSEGDMGGIGSKRENLDII